MRDNKKVESFSSKVCNEKNKNKNNPNFYIFLFYIILLFLSSLILVPTDPLFQTRILLSIGPIGNSNPFFSWQTPDLGKSSLWNFFNPHQGERIDDPLTNSQNFKSSLCFIHTCRLILLYIIVISHTKFCNFIVFHKVSVIIGFKDLIINVYTHRYFRRPKTSKRLYSNFSGTRN